MRYYKYLLMSPELEQKRTHILEKLNHNKIQRQLYLLILPEHGKEQLEIVEAKFLLQPGCRSEDDLVVGITRNFDQALNMVEFIAKEVYDKTKKLDIRSYIIEKEQEE